MQITYKTEGDYVKSVKAECSPVEWLLISTGLSLIANNPNLSIKDRRLAKKMIISVKDYDRLCNKFDSEGVLDKIRAEIEQEYNLLSATRADETLELGECLGLKMSLKIIDKYKAESEDAE